jgi:heme/copper-type cytochrome/quinol oxidase subunit 2
MMDSLIFLILAILIYLPVIGIGIFCMIQFIRLANRGIKALDIYIEKESK